MVKAIIFDLDNTLYSYDGPSQYAEEQVGEWLKKNKKIEYQVYRDVYNQSKMEIKRYTSGQGASHNRMLYFQKFCELMGWKPTDCALELYDVYWDSFLDAIKINDGVTELFDFLTKNGIKIAICTELTAHIQHRKIRKLSIEDYVDVLVSSEEAGSEKSNNTIFDLTVEKLGVMKSESLFVGDNYEKDIVGAQRAGIKAILFDTTGENDSICSMLELRKIITELNGGYDS